MCQPKPNRQHDSKIYSYKILPKQQYQAVYRFGLWIPHVPVLSLTPRANTVVVYPKSPFAVGSQEHHHRAVVCESTASALLRKSSARAGRGGGRGGGG